MDLGRIYKELRQALKDENGNTVSIKALAEKMGLAASRISELENNKREMSLTELKAYHKYFKVSFEYLLGETDVKSVNEKLQTACEVTGLSEDAINNIIELQNFPNSFKILDYFLEYKDDGGMHIIFQMANEMFKMKDKLLIEEKRVSKDKLLKDDREKFKEAQNLLQNTIFDVILVSDKVHIFEEQVKRALYSPIFNYGKSLGIPGFEEDLENADDNKEG
ncbi:MAG: helix-turn-helix domain-containing protein [Porcipelethomonas sp.]